MAASATTIADLPNELLSAIFAHLRPCPNDLFSALRVCARWREITRADAHLWRTAGHVTWRQALLLARHHDHLPFRLALGAEVAAEARALKEAVESLLSDDVKSCVRAALLRNVVALRLAPTDTWLEELTVDLWSFFDGSTALRELVTSGTGAALTCFVNLNLPALETIETSYLDVDATDIVRAWPRLSRLRGHCFGLTEEEVETNFRWPQLETFEFSYVTQAPHIQQLLGVCPNLRALTLREYQTPVNVYGVPPAPTASVPAQITCLTMDIRWEESFVEWLRYDWSRLVSLTIVYTSAHITDDEAARFKVAAYRFGPRERAGLCAFAESHRALEELTLRCGCVDLTKYPDTLIGGMKGLRSRSRLQRLTFEFTIRIAEKLDAVVLALLDFLAMLFDQRIFGTDTDTSVHTSEGAGGAPAVGGVAGVINWRAFWSEREQHLLRNLPRNNGEVAVADPTSDVQPLTAAVPVAVPGSFLAPAANGAASNQTPNHSPIELSTMAGHWDGWRVHTDGELVCQPHRDTRAELELCVTLVRGTWPRELP